MMNATQEKLVNILASDAARTFLVNFICAIFIAVFGYSAASELFSTNTLHKFIRKFKFLNSSVLILTSYIPVIELCISVLLLFSRTKLAGLIASAVFVTISTVYMVYLALSTAQSVCHCGFSLSRLNSVEQIWFNVLLLVLAAVAIFLTIRIKRSRDENLGTSH